MHKLMLVTVLSTTLILSTLTLAEAQDTIAWTTDLYNNQVLTFAVQRDGATYYQEGSPFSGSPTSCGNFWGAGPQQSITDVQFQRSGPVLFMYVYTESGDVFVQPLQLYDGSYRFCNGANGCVPNLRGNFWGGGPVPTATTTIGGMKSLYKRQ